MQAPETNTITMEVLAQQQQTGVVLDKLVNILFTSIPKQVICGGPNVKPDIQNRDVRMQGVRVMSNITSPYNLISREVRLCSNVDLQHSEAYALQDIQSCFTTVCKRAVFTETQNNYSVHYPTSLSDPTDKSSLVYEKLDIMKLCQALPLCYSPSFEMTPLHSRLIHLAQTFNSNMKGINVIDIGHNKVDQNNQSHPQKPFLDKVILTPRHVGGGILYSTTLHTMYPVSSSETLQNHENNVSQRLLSTANKNKHPRFGVSLAKHMDSLVVQVHDHATTTVSKWMNSLCSNNNDMKKLIESNNHGPTIAHVNTAHCAYMSAVKGVTVLIQDHDFVVSAPALLRYGINVATENKLSMKLVSVIYHGPTIHKS
jgi:hypothetical protein